MIRAALSVIAAAALIGSASAAPQKRRAAPPPPPKPVVLGDTVRVVLTTEMGAITLDLDHAHAPITVENFVRYVDQKKFDGTIFYRAMHLDWGDQPNGLIQGGTQNNPAKTLPPIAHEPTNVTGIQHKAGTISMARNAPGSATGDFSILLSDLEGLDANPKAEGDNVGYAAFGHVVDGMDVVRRIWDVPRSPTLGEGFLKGQMLEKPVRIVSARRIEIPAPAPTPAPPPPTP